MNDHIKFEYKKDDSFFMKIKIYFINLFLTFLFNLLTYKEKIDLIEKIFKD